MTKSEAVGTVSTFATFRVSGDRLDPEAVSRILSAHPTTAYRKGEHYFAGPRSGELVGRTGVWYLSTKDLVSGLNPIEHLSYLTRLFEKEHRRTALRDLIKREGLTADASLFWHGSADGREPEIPRAIDRVFDSISARLERDYDRD